MSISFSERSEKDFKPVVDKDLKQVLTLISTSTFLIFWLQMVYFTDFSLAEAQNILTYA